MRHNLLFGVYTVDTDLEIYVMDDFGTLVPLEFNHNSNYFFRFS
jgi:hypothetical protein